MNRKGFTLIELITTFGLASVLIILLINIVLVIKNLYSENNIKSELIIEKSNLLHLMNKKFDTDFLDSYLPCQDSDFCYNFYFVDGSVSKLVVSDNSITFDNYTYKAKKGIKIGNPTLELIDIVVSSDEANNSFLVIKIPVKHKMYPNEDFGVKLVYTYNSNKITL